MKTRIENGVTIISTGKSGNEVLNKTGHIGVTYYSRNKKYRSEISIKQHKYLLGFFDDMQTAINARMVADKKKEEGILEEWIATKPHGNSDAFVPFWNELFNKYNLM